MRRAARLVMAVAAMALLAAGGAGATGVPAAGADRQAWEAVPGGWVSGSVEHLRTLAEDAVGASDAVLHGDRLYVSTWRSVSVYDVADPANPRRLGSLPLVPGLYAEEPQTDGDILLVSRDAQFAPGRDFLPPVTHHTPRVGGVMEVFRVGGGRTTPEPLATYESDQRDHLWTCVLDCAYAYSAFGSIVDLRRPEAPAKVGSWKQRAGVSPRLEHHIAEVAPGVVLTGGVPMYVLDASDPEQPRVIASLTPPTTRPGKPQMQEAIPARTAWPQHGTDEHGSVHDRFLLVSMETPFTGPCGDWAGEVLTFDTEGWRTGGGFRPVGRYQLPRNGTYTDGNPPYNAVGCSAYGLAAHPRYGVDGDRRAAVTFFEHGVRVLAVEADGALAERGGFVPHAGNSATVVWVSDEVLYVIDLQRGIDVLRVRP
jgi:hypothetical protein